MRPLLERDGCELWGDDSGGEGIPVLFSHGAGADAAMFAPQYEALAADGYRVVTWDLRGHGKSRPAHQPITTERAIADLVALVAELGLDRPVLVGQSLGGNLSQAVVRRHPDLARALIVIGSTWNTGPLTRVEKLLLSLSTPMMAAIPPARLARLMGDASASTPAGKRYAETAFRSLLTREFLDAWRTALGLLESDPDYRTPVPLLLIRGELDRTGNIATAMPRWAAAEGVPEHVIEGAGHIANLDAPEQVSALLLQFLRGL